MHEVELASRQRLQRDWVESCRALALAVSVAEAPSVDCLFGFWQSIESN